MASQKLAFISVLMHCNPVVTGLMFPSNNRGSTSAYPQSLSYQTYPETVEAVGASSSSLHEDEIYENTLYSPYQDDSNSLVSFLTSSDAGTGHVEHDDHSSYYTLDPTLDMLIDWTLDYVDAIDLAGGMTRVSVGVEEMMSPDFVFTSPAIGPLSKNDFINLMKYYQYNGLDLASAIPDLTASFEGWHQDPHDPWRIWAIARYSGTHTGTAKLPGTGLTLSPSREPKKFTTGPELQSFLWTPSKKLIWQTVGYIGDKNTGSNQGHGNLNGLLVSMGLPPLYLETTEPLRNLQNFLAQFQQSEDAPRVTSPYSHLPQWWHERKTLGRNIQR